MDINKGKCKWAVLVGQPTINNRYPNLSAIGGFMGTYYDTRKEALSSAKRCAAANNYWHFEIRKYSAKRGYVRDEKK